MLTMPNELVKLSPRLYELIAAEILRTQIQFEVKVPLIRDVPLHRRKVRSGVGNGNLLILLQLLQKFIHASCAFRTKTQNVDHVFVHYLKHPRSRASLFYCKLFLLGI